VSSTDDRTGEPEGGDAGRQVGEELNWEGGAVLPVKVDPEVLYWVLLAALATVVVLNQAARQALLTRLQRDHRPLWEDLGEPRLLSTRSWPAVVKRPRIIWARVVWELPGAEIRRLVRLARLTDVLAFVVLAVLVVVVAVMFRRQ
jgi:hypothetical protein